MDAYSLMESQDLLLILLTVVGFRFLVFLLIILLLMPAEFMILSTVVLLISCIIRALKLIAI